MPLNARGFTVIEALIGAALLGLALMGVVAMMTYFGTQSRDRVLQNCVLDAAINGLNQYKASAPLASSSPFSCGNITGTITMSHTSLPTSNTCNDVTATATVSGKSITLQTKICNFQ
jgi:Tfp pilus assembly protein PilV